MLRHPATVLLMSAALLLPMYLGIASENTAISLYDTFDLSKVSKIMVVIFYRGIIKDLEKRNNSCSFKAVRVKTLLIGVIYFKSGDRSRFVTILKLKNQSIKMRFYDTERIKAEFYGIIRPRFILGVYTAKISFQQMVPEIHWEVSISDRKITITSVDPPNLPWSSILVKADIDNVVISFNGGANHTIGTVPIPMTSVGASGYVTPGDTITVHEPLDRDVTLTLIYEPTGDVIAEIHVPA